MSTEVIIGISYVAGGMMALLTVYIHGRDDDRPRWLRWLITILISMALIGIADWIVRMFS